MAKKLPEIGTLVCGECGQEVSGPNFESVAAAMERHRQKTGHKG